MMKPLTITLGTRYALGLGLKIGAQALRATAATNAFDHDADIAKV
jgi:integrase/recombinase XerD